MVEVAESRAAKSLVQEKEALIPNLEHDLQQARFYTTVECAANNSIIMLINVIMFMFQR